MEMCPPPADLPSSNTLGPLSPNPPQAISPGQPSPYPRLRSPLPPSQALDQPIKDFRYLIRPELYHPLSQLEIPPPFRDRQPLPNTPLSTLISTGNFRAAATSAARQLTTSTSPTDHAQIFHLLYVRLACLTLCNATPYAAQEVKALEDLNSAYYREDVTNQSRHLVPWNLRVIAVRLQGIGFNDSRKGVMGYYDLAREARLLSARLKSRADSDPSNNDEEKKMWEARLGELGILVASALIEMGDLSGAAHHLSTLRSLPGQPNIAVMKALLYILIGDIQAAESCVPQISSDPPAPSTISALISMSSGDFPLAIAQWKALLETDPKNALYAQNLAVTLIYTNQMAEARSLLEGLVDQGNSFHALTMNLSIVYELCTERSKGMKIALAEKVARLEKAEQGYEGWEKVNADFRL